MKKSVIKVIGIVILSFFLIYTLFIVEEFIRLSNNSLAEPLIVFGESYSDDGATAYKSLGFTLITEYSNNEGLIDKSNPVSQEFWLFDRLLIWAWIS